MSEAQEKLPGRLERALRALSEGYKEILKKGGIKDEASVLEHAALLYGSASMIAYLLGSVCEEQVARSLELAKDELSRVADYLSEDKEAKERDARKVAIRLVALEAVIRQVTAHCLGLEN
jgi:tRNA A58 N-methylase Trm61